MKSMIAGLMVAALPGISFANGSGDAEQESLAFTEVSAIPQVSVIALTPLQAETLAKVRSEYKARVLSLEAEYKAILDTVLASTEADKS